MRIWPTEDLTRVRVEAKTSLNNTAKTTMNSNSGGTCHSKDKLEVEELSKGLKVRTDKPHLVSLGGGRLSTAVTIIPLDKGITTFGSAKDRDIIIQGQDIQEEHCYIENSSDSVVRLCPGDTALVSIDGTLIHTSTTLNQGCMLCLGRANYFRFNHPEQAMKLKGDNNVMSLAAVEESCSTSQHREQCVNGKGNHNTKGHLNINLTSSPGVSTLASSTASASSGEDSLSPSKYQDDLADESFTNKLKRFETLTSTSPKTERAMPLQGNPHKFSYMNYVGEKLFTKDTSTTRLSIDGSEISSKNGYGNNNEPEDASVKPPKPELKPKPFVKPKPRLEHKSSNGGDSPTNARTEFKTLSMISTETSIWGSTSSAGTFRLDDEAPSPLSCTTPTGVTENTMDESDSDTDVFNDGEVMTNSLSSKHQKMIEERKLEEEMERKEQERLEEILAMCAQYEEQIDSEKQLTSTVTTGSTKSTTDTYVSTPSSMWMGSRSIGLTSSSFGQSTYDKSSTSIPSSIPDVLSDSIHTIMSTSVSSGSSDRKNIKTNGSLLHSPTSPTYSKGNAFTYNYVTNTPTKTSHVTTPVSSGASNPYQDDTHLYDCPADILQIEPKKPERLDIPKTGGSGLLLTTSMNASLYDDSRIYDSPADFMAVPPPIPSHSKSEGQKSAADRLITASSSPSTSSSERRHHRSGESTTSSELTVVSSSGSYRTAVPELSSSTHNDSKKTDEARLHLESLKLTRSEILEKISDIKHQVTELENQQSEAVRELEMEQALLQGEQQAELEILQSQWKESDLLKTKKLTLINNYAKQREERQKKIEEARVKLQQMEDRRVEIEERLRVAADDEKDELLSLYEKELDALDNQKKVFEDLEFQQLEIEAKFEEESEAVQKELISKQTDLASKIRKAEENLATMTRQQTDMMEQTRNELFEMEKQRKQLVTEFQKEKQKMLQLDHRMRDMQKSIGNGVMKSSHNEKEEMILTTPAATLNRDLLAKLRTGDIIMEEERRRLENLKHAATEASLLQWSEQRTFRGTLDSEDETRSTRSSNETPSDMMDKISYNSSTDDPDRFSELQMLLAQARYHVQNAENSDLANERRMRSKLEQQLAEERAKRDELIEQQVQLREKTNLTTNNGNMRPLTRYLPVREDEFDLRQHIESTGHNLGTCPFVEVTSTQCKGYLLKMGTKHKTWNKRWFVFDREKKALLYYMDKSEHKPRGGIYFQSIEDVFVDHMRTVKSPNHKFTFCVKTYDKPYYLVAKSPEALSIWIDVIFTGAEGHQEF